MRSWFAFEVDRLNRVRWYWERRREQEIGAANSHRGANG